MRHPLAGFILAVATAGATQAEVVRVTVDSRAPLAGDFGAVGPYEVIKGRVFGELDPADPKNAIIQDIGLAPRNARGKVEYSTTFAMSKPVDMAKANGFLFYDVPNRGNMAVGGDPRGRVHLTSGWQGDIPPSPTQQYGTFPVAKNPDGSSVVGPAMARFVNFSGPQSRPLRGGNAPGVPRPPPATLDSSQATLLRYSSDADPGAPVPAADFAFATCTAEAPFPGTPDGGQLCLRGGFNPVYAYNLVYLAKDPVVMGIGIAATRDVIAFFRHTPDTAAAPNPIAGKIKFVIGTGVSQSGNFLRSMINLGFTQDEKGRRVFDGVNPQIAGRQSATNIRFAMPGGSSFLYDAGFDGTMWWSRYNDIKRGQGTHSLLDRCNASDTCPKVIETFGSTEFWGLRMSPNLVGTDGKADLPLPANVRRYYFPSVTHGGGDGGFALLTMDSAKPNGCALPANPNPSDEYVAALQVALEAWVSTGKPPPPSVYPTIANGDLVAPNLTGAPHIPNQPRAGDVINPFLTYDFGPEYRAADNSGIMTTLPPRIARNVNLLVPRVDSDGNETSGIPSVQLQVPLGTYLGWNLFSAGYYKGTICGYQGGFIPFARTKAERIDRGDPRPSLEERYPSHAEFLAKVKSAADSLARRGFLLPADAAKIVIEADQSPVGLH